MEVRKTRGSFKDLCLHDRPSLALEQEHGWFVGKNCRYCKQPVNENDFDVAFSYWKIYGVGPAWFPAHKDCIKDGYAAEVKECQTIDADCNDCKHFLRGSGNNGFCHKKSQNVMASPNTFTGMPCFKHRRG